MRSRPVASTRARWVSVFSASDHCRDSVRLRAARAARSSRARAISAGSGSVAFIRSPMAWSRRMSSLRTARSTLAWRSRWPLPARSISACCSSATRDSLTSSVAASPGMVRDSSARRGRDREPGRRAEAGGVRLQLGPVVGQDGAPARVGVDLGQREHHDVDPFAGLDEEFELGAGERRGGVDDEQQRGGPLRPRPGRSRRGPGPARRCRGCRRGSGTAAAAPGG